MIFNLFNNVVFHWLTNQIVLSTITITRFVNLQVTNMIVLKSFDEINNVKMKFIIIIWNKIENVKMNCINSYET